MSAISKLDHVLTKQADVFGIQIFASKHVSTNDFNHAQAVLAEYLDNDENGIVDNKAVVESLVSNDSALIMFQDQDSAEDFHRKSKEWIEDLDLNVYELYGDETHPHGSSSNRGFDASLEEILHLITEQGYARVYPNIFGMENGDKKSLLQKAMDRSRGGFFPRTPKSYPERAWFTYNDRTCDYECNTNEYIYWGLTSILGAQQYPGRKREISDEWRLNTANKVYRKDKHLYRLLSNPAYGFPSSLPDGSYFFRSHTTATDRLSAPNRYGKRFAQTINFSNDALAKPLQIDVQTFGLDLDASIKTAKSKNSLRKMAKNNTDFIYLPKNSCIYFNQNKSQKGWGDGGIFAILDDAPISVENFIEFI